ncbi:MAG: hypothetical protein CM1200mP40_18590 [Gammaproteobacteria bacterium]|nr:MAG: hypothetical protein CM1200mP40_18590 [Gammaproteobacteria bacterium]
MLERQYEVLEILQGLTVKEAYENQGYRYREDTSTRGLLAVLLRLLIWSGSERP